MSEDLFKEIDADMRAEKLRDLVRRYAKLVIAIVVILLIVIGVWQFQKWQQRKEMAEASASYAQIMQQINPLFTRQAGDEKTVQQGITQLNRFSAQAPQSIRALARFKEASLLAEQGKIRQASLIWNSIRFDRKASSDFRALASLLWIQNNLDSADQKELHNRVTELLGQKTLWYAMVKECEGMLDLRTGKLIEAKQVFGALSMDGNISPGIKKRANMMLQIIASREKG